VLFFLCRQFCLHFWLCVNSSLWYSSFQILRKSFQWKPYAECSKSFGLHKSAWERQSHPRPVLVPRRIPQKAWKGAGMKWMVPHQVQSLVSGHYKWDMTIWRDCSHWSMSNGLNTSLWGILAFWYHDTGYLCVRGRTAIISLPWSFFCLQNQLKVYLAPFLHGHRYTSFGRHFTKIEKLREVWFLIQLVLLYVFSYWCPWVHMENVVCFDGRVVLVNWNNSCDFAGCYQAAVVCARQRHGRFPDLVMTSPPVNLVWLNQYDQCSHNEPVFMRVTCTICPPWYRVSVQQTPYQWLDVFLTC
jgi:hypothetical protein